jgi:hypothetical protein
MQYIFAKNWPMKAYFVLAATVGIWLVISICQPSLGMFADWQFLVLFIVSITLGPILFIYLTLPCAWLFLGPLYHLRAKLNGAPFHVGDRVRILVGPHRNCVVQVYDVWSERNQVRVELGAQARAEVSDVFSCTQVYREVESQPR